MATFTWFTGNKGLNVVHEVYSRWPSTEPAGDETEEIEHDAATGWAEGFWQCGLWFCSGQVGETKSRILQGRKNKEPEAMKRDGAVAAHEAVMPDLHEA